MTKRPSVFLIAAVVVFLAGCAGPTKTSATPMELVSATAPKQVLTIFAASSLTEAFTDLAENFEKSNPNVDVQINFAGSQQLAEQLTQGASADVFASASPKYMNSVLDNGLTTPEEVTTFARNRLVVITPLANPAGISTFVDIAKPNVKLVIADEAVPVGKYTLNFLRAAGLEKIAALNVVSYEENVKAVLTKVVLGEADAGVVYSSDVNPAVVDQILTFLIPDEFNEVAEYPICALRQAPNVGLAQEFIELVLSDQGQTILAEYHFLPAR